MKIEVLASSTAGEPMQFAASYRIDDHVVIDAGSIGFAKLEVQRAIQHVLLTHCHMDHIASLPLLIDNHCGLGVPCPKIYGSRHVLDCLRKHFFNDALWPDLDRIGRERNKPFAEFIELNAGVPVAFDHLTVTPIELDHVVPCFGFVVQDSKSTVAVVSDTGPTHAIWNHARECTNLKAVFLEAAVPNSFGWLADQAKHLTPETFLTEYTKLGRDVPIFAVHIKPVFHEQVIQELTDLRLPRLEIAEPRRTYHF